MTKILVIEDEQTIRENLMDLLDAEDFEVLGAGDGKIGVELAQTHLPDLVICDVMMPKLDGFGVLNSLRSTPATTMIPFIFLTAKADQTDWRQGIELGADDYLTKPFTRKDLLGAISVRLQKKAAIEQQQVQKLNELRNSITLSLPNEMRSPLNNILGFSHFLIQDAAYLEEKEIRKMSRTIQRSAERLERLIQNFLLYTELEIIATDNERIAALRNNQTHSAVSVIGTVAIAQAQQIQRTVDLQLELQDSTVQIARGRLRKILEELLDNAFKYSIPSTPVRVFCAPVGNIFVLSITNSGRGISAEQIERIGAYHQFERQVYEQQGLGLGLIITKRLAELLGGELIIESVPEQETTVRVILPI